MSEIKKRCKAQCIKALGHKALLFVFLAYVGSVVLMYRWANERAAPLQPKVQVIHIKKGQELEIKLPELVSRAETYSIVQNIESDRQFVEFPDQGTPKLRIPPNLDGGTYTVALHMSYWLNPVKYVRQQAVLAVVTVD